MVNPMNKSKAGGRSKALHTKSSAPFKLEHGLPPADRSGSNQFAANGAAPSSG